jgi:nitrogen fixation NifU-like protein
MYSEEVRALFRAPAHAGKAAGETHRGVGGTPGGGPFVVLSLRVAEGVVREARFQTYGCPAAIACSEVACVWCEGQPLSALPVVTAADVTRWVAGVPEGKEHCPELAARALAQVVASGQPAMSMED